MSESIRDQLEKAFSAAESGTLDVPRETTPEPVESVEAVETAPVEETAEARARDEAGRFSKPAEATPVKATRKPPPSSWKQDYWAHYEKFAPEVQDYIHQREQEAHQGVSTYKQQVDQFAPINKALQSFLPGLQQRGISAEKWLDDLGKVDRILASGSPQEKAQLIYRMAANNGIQLGGQGQPTVDQGLQSVLQEVAGVKSQLQAFQSTQAQQEQVALNAQIKAFGDTHPHLEKVRATMGQLLQSKVVDGDSFATPQEAMEAAYEKAIRLHDDVWKDHQASQAKEAEAERQKELKRKQAAASSPRSSSPTGALATVNGKKSIRESLEESFNAVSGRV